MMRHMGAITSSASAATPARLAIADDHRKLSYAQLEQLSVSFAGRLMSMGVVKGDRVVVLAHKSAASVAAIFGVLKAGAAYVPVDCALPAARLRYLIDDIAPRCVVADAGTQSLAQSLGFEADRTLRCDIDLAPIADADTRRLVEGALPAPSETDAAYCIYTSGSTGRPKGVVISHGSVMSFFDAAQPHMQVDSDSRCLNTSPLHFDVSLIDLFYPLSRGAEVHLFSGPPLANRYLGLIEQAGITHFAAVGPTLALMTQGTLFPKCRFEYLERIMTGAEKLNVAMIQRWLAAVPGVVILNGYGPTEATCVCTSYAIDTPEAARTALYPIGKPWNGVQVLLLGDDGATIEQPNEPGELLIGGAQLMTGYWNRSEETSRSLVHRDGIRYYRSGDICEWLDSGDLFFIGRRDDEIKLSGYRINLNEIYRVIYEVGGFAEALVSPLQDAKGSRKLVIGVVPRTAIAPAEIAEELLGRMRGVLPEYMVPSHCFLLRELPKLSSGKTDVQSLVQRFAAAIDAAPAPWYVENDEAVLHPGLALASRTSGQTA